MKQNSSRRVGVLYVGPANPILARLQTLAPTVRGIGWVSAVPAVAVAEEALRASRPDVLVLSVRPPGAEEHRQVYALRQRVELPPLVLLCSCQPDQLSLLALSVGAVDCLSERLPPRSILNAIVGLGHGNTSAYHSLALAHRLSGAVTRALKALPPYDHPAPPPDPLSRRQREVLGLVAQGCSNKEVGATLYIQEQTVKNHVSAIMDRVGTRDRATAAAIALRNGWLPLP